MLLSRATLLVTTVLLSACDQAASFTAKATKNKDTKESNASIASEAPTCQLTPENALTTAGSELNFQLKKTGSVNAVSSSDATGVISDESFRVQPSQTTTYTLTVSGPGGSATCTTTATVDGGPVADDGSDAGSDGTRTVDPAADNAVVPQCSISIPANLTIREGDSVVLSAVVPQTGAQAVWSDSSAVINPQQATRTITAGVAAKDFSIFLNAGGQRVGGCSISLTIAAPSTPPPPSCWSSLANASVQEIKTEQDLKTIHTGRALLVNDIALTSPWVPVDALDFWLEGGGHKISGLSVNSASLGTGSNAGLYGLLERGYINNLVLDGVSVDSSAAMSGGLAGLARDSLVTGVTVQGGSVKSTSSVDAFVGGLLGRLLGTGACPASVSSVKSSATVSLVQATRRTSNVGGLLGGAFDGNIAKAWASGDVVSSPTGYYVGGLAGVVEGGTLKSSKASGNVTSAGSIFIGGLVGMSYSAEVSDVYATGTVDGSGAFAGGLIGGLADGRSAGTSVKNSYAATTMSIGSSCGLTQDTHNGANATILGSSFFDADKTSAANCGVGVGKTSAELRDPATFAGWDASIWRLVSGQYPQLIWE